MIQKSMVVSGDKWIAPHPHATDATVIYGIAAREAEDVPAGSSLLEPESAKHRQEVHNKRYRLSSVQASKLAPQGADRFAVRDRE